MTLIASMKSKGCAVIISDSQETVKDSAGNEFKYAVLKSVPENIRGFRYVIAGGGDADGIDELTEEFRRSLRKSTFQSLEGFRLLLERKLADELKYLRATDPGARLQLIVAASRRKRWEVWRTANRKLVATVQDAPTLIGFDAEIYKHVGSSLFVHTSSLPQLALVGIRIMELARRSSTCVDAPYHGLIVGSHGISRIGNRVMGELRESVETFSASLDRLLLACSDTSLAQPDFEKMIEEFKASAIHLRGDYLQSVGEKQFLDEFYGDGFGGFAFLPRNSFVNATMLSGGKIDVTVGPIKQSASQKSEGQP